MKNLIQFLLILELFKLQLAADRYGVSQTILELGDSCILSDNNESGICKVATDCTDLFKTNRTIKICGFQNRESIICCPNANSNNVLSYYDSHQDDGPFVYKEFTSECIVPTTKEKGFHKFIKHCPRIAEEVKNGAPFPKICDYEICKDMVCCPVGGLKRKNEVCSQYDDIEYNLYNRISVQPKCLINGKDGIVTYTSDCDSALENIKNGKTNPRICDYKVCEDFVCCPIENQSIRIKAVEHSEFFYTKFEAGSCIDKVTGEDGICKTRNQCETSTSKNYTTCGYDSCNEFICCPIKRFTSKSLQACENYKETVFENTITVEKLTTNRNKTINCYAALPAGGRQAKPKEFPHMAALGYQIGSNPIIWNCGGSLISDRFVLTAAHCINSDEFGSVQHVRLGALTIDAPDTLACPEEYKVIERIVHPKYNISQRYNDVALLKLDRIVSFNPHVRPACLSNSPDLLTGVKLTGMGWGQTGFAAPRTDWLVRVEIEKYDHKICNKYFEGDSKLPSGILDETQMCAGSKDSIDDTCPGDSGGPIQIKKHYYMAEIVGITSFGNACGFKNSPAVYTKVYPFVKWIESIVWS